MPSGAAVIRYEGQRGVTWRIKYRDATGAQVQETLGREPKWSRQKAERELGKRLDRVERDHWRRPSRLTFDQLADRFLSEYVAGRNRKKSTRVDYTATLRNHLRPAFGHLTLDAIAARPEVLDRYIATKAKTLSPKTIRNHLALLHIMFKVAQRWRYVQSNPLAEVDPPTVPRPDTVILADDDVAGLLNAYRDLEIDPPKDTEREWWATARRMTIAALGTALRRGELLGLRWGDVELGERRLHVRQQWTRDEFTTPKSRASQRTVDFGAKTAEALEEQYQASRYRADSDLVFGHPLLGTPFNPSKLTSCYVKVALKKAGIDRPTFQPWHGLRHTALTGAAAADNPNVYVQARAGHSQFSVTERYVHAAKTAFPGAADRTEDRLFAGLADEGEVQTPVQEVEA
jgi:integrase